MNTQKPRPRVTRTDALSVHSVFYTLQGEGMFAGHPAVFVRLADCNLQCPGCDTIYTTQDPRLKEFPNKELANWAGVIADYQGCDLIVITGGEPFRQDIAPFVKLLLNDGFNVQIETNGTLPCSKEFIECKEQWGTQLSVCVSPKMHFVNPTIQDITTYYKYVIRAADLDPEDGLPNRALELNLLNGKKLFRPKIGSAAVYVTPYDCGDETENRENLLAAAQSALDHGYIFGVQLHKYCDQP